MTSRPLKVLKLLGTDPLAAGHQHGEIFRREIKEISEIRLERMCATSAYPKVKDVLALASKHIPLLEEFDVDLFLELRGIAEASNVSLPHLVVLNQYTDMRDIGPTHIKNLNNPHQELEDDGGCSVIFSPGKSGPILGQTWDIHGSAEPYVILIKREDALLFSITGCLGMTGINHHGVAIAINNLASKDAKIGVLWPALIRKGLTCQTAVLAKREIEQATLGSGRHFAIADAHHFFSLETSGSKKKVVWDKSDQLYFHTNHCLDKEMRETHTIRKESTTLWRYQQLNDVIRYDDLSTVENVFLALAKVSSPVDKREIHKTATCGTIAMDIKQRMMIACEGIATEELLQWPQTKVYI